jgi:hypothetical protein
MATINDAMAAISAAHIWADMAPPRVSLRTGYGIESALI